jgi:diketogulonate reductase-like aldo/keto reductase
MAVSAYCGMAVGRVFSDPTLKGIAARHGKGIAQIVLRWLVQQNGVVALSRTRDRKNKHPGSGAPRVLGVEQQGEKPRQTG